MMNRYEVTTGLFRGPISNSNHLRPCLPKLGPHNPQLSSGFVVGFPYILVHVRLPLAWEYGQCVFGERELLQGNWREQEWANMAKLLYHSTISIIIIEIFVHFHPLKMARESGVVQF